MQVEQPLADAPILPPQVQPAQSQQLVQTSPELRGTLERLVALQTEALQQSMRQRRVVDALGEAQREGQESLRTLMQSMAIGYRSGEAIRHAQPPPTFSGEIDSLGIFIDSVYNIAWPSIVMTSSRQ